MSGGGACRAPGRRSSTWSRRRRHRQRGRRRRGMRDIRRLAAARAAPHMLVRRQGAALGGFGGGDHGVLVDVQAPAAASSMPACRISMRRAGGWRPGTRACVPAYVQVVPDGPARRRAPAPPCSHALRRTLISGPNPHPPARAGAGFVGDRGSAGSRAPRLRAPRRPAAPRAARRPHPAPPGRGGRRVRLALRDAARRPPRPRRDVAHGGVFVARRRRVVFVSTRSRRAGARPPPRAPRRPPSGGREPSVWTPRPMPRMSGRRPMSPSTPTTVRGAD